MRTIAQQDNGAHLSWSWPRFHLRAVKRLNAPAALRRHGDRLLTKGALIRALCSDTLESAHALGCMWVP